MAKPGIHPIRGPRKPREPKVVGELLDGLAGQPGWGERMAVARLRGRWAEVAGEAIAAHCEPVRLDSGTLTIRSEPGVWATEITMLGRRLGERAAAVLGAGSVREVRVVTGKVEQ